MILSIVLTESHLFFLIVIYKKERTSNKVTNALFMFVERYRSAVQLGLMVVIKKFSEYHVPVSFFYRKN